MPLNLTGSHFTGLQTPILAERWALLTHSWKRWTAGESPGRRDLRLFEKTPLSSFSIYGAHTRCEALHHGTSFAARKTLVTAEMVNGLGAS